MRFAFISEAYGAEHARDIDRSTDRGAHPGVLSRRSAPGEVLCKPWATQNAKGLFTKRDFVIDARAGTITCPNGEVERFESGATVEFDPEACGGCRLRAQCTHSASGRGRTIHIADDESRQHRFRELRATPAGRMRLRRRTQIEHDLAHIAARKGRRARYRGKRKNTFHLRRTSTVQNLEAAQRYAGVMTLDSTCSVF